MLLGMNRVSLNHQRCKKKNEQGKENSRAGRSFQEKVCKTKQKMIDLTIKSSDEKEKGTEIASFSCLFGSFVPSTLELRRTF